MRNAQVEPSRTFLREWPCSMKNTVPSLKADASRSNELVRTHWGFENSLHWVLDVTFQEDGSRVRKGQAYRNLAAARRWALNLCKLDIIPFRITGSPNDAPLFSPSAG